MASSTAFVRVAPSAPTTNGTKGSTTRTNGASFSFSFVADDELESINPSSPLTASRDAGSRVSVAPPPGSHSHFEHAVSWNTVTCALYFSSISSRSTATRRSRWITCVAYFLSLKRITPSGLCGDQSIRPLTRLQ
jgi:hypothetical protein